MIELERVVNQILGIQAGVGHAVVFNDGQSTHTTSVHASVSASAKKLFQTYGHDLNLEAKIKEVREDINGLADSLKNKAAKACIGRIGAVNYIFTDSSGISTRQLLALAYTAIHDDNKRSGTLEDAKSLFVDALYEIERGYNLDDSGQDRGGNNSPICPGGTFNKLMEKLNGIHADVEVYYITHAGAILKFPKLAAAHATTHLQSLATPSTAEEYLKIKDLLEKIKTEGSIELIWVAIKAEVKAELWDEFKEAYNNNENNPDFLNLIDSGQYVPLPDLSAIYKALQVSPGYQACLKKQLRLGLEQHSLWANRHSNQHAQDAFDKQYGLVLKPLAKNVNALMCKTSNLI